MHFDVIITNGGNSMHPRTDNYIIPQPRLHMTPQTIGGWHADATDLRGQRAPMQSCTADELASIGRYQAILRTPRVPTNDQEHISELILGPPTDAYQQWPDNIEGNLVKYPANLLRYMIDHTETVILQQQGNTANYTTVVNREEIVDHRPYDAQETIRWVPRRRPEQPDVPFVRPTRVNIDNLMTIDLSDPDKVDPAYF